MCFIALRKMETKHLCRTFFLMLLLAESVRPTGMGGVKYNRQCGYAVTVGVMQWSPSSIMCACACTALSPCQCYGFIYQIKSEMCQLLPRSNVITVAPNDTCQPQTCIMVGVVQALQSRFQNFK